MASFPAQQPGVFYLTEGGTETEIMYKHGHELPEFASYPLLDSPAAVQDLTMMFTAYLEVAARHGFIPLMGGLDYRASQDWATNLGISAEGLREYQLRSIQFLRDIAKPFSDRIPQVLFVGTVGPRNDAYDGTATITADEAEEYHAAQIATLQEAGVDLVSALTFNSTSEAVGLARATAAADLPLSMSFMVDEKGCLLAGPTMQVAIETIDEEAGDARPDFYGINCSHPVEFEPALGGQGPWQSRIRSLRPNASMKDKIELCQMGHLESGDPDMLGKQVAALTRRFPSVDIVGGCCGTWDDHFEAIARELSA